MSRREYDLEDILAEYSDPYAVEIPEPEPLPEKDTAPQTEESPEAEEFEEDLGEEEISDASFAAFREELENLGLSSFLAIWQEAANRY